MAQKRFAKEWIIGPFRKAEVRLDKDLVDGSRWRVGTLELEAAISKLDKTSC